MSQQTASDQSSAEVQEQQALAYLQEQEQQALDSLLGTLRNNWPRNRQKLVVQCGWCRRPQWGAEEATGLAGAPISPPLPLRVSMSGPSLEQSSLGRLMKQQGPA
mmetsp:Transcript_110246/g.235432  ORF Transcript_110246/g.235432 Transcript_110246/m.235432 type:complete len:105 (+) Transcript_110246:766-1080(+)